MVEMWKTWQGQFPRLPECLPGELGELGRCVLRYVPFCFVKITQSLSSLSSVLLREFSLDFFLRQELLDWKDLSTGMITRNNQCVSSKTPTHLRSLYTCFYVEKQQQVAKHLNITKFHGCQSLMFWTSESPHFSTIFHHSRCSKPWTPMDSPGLEPVRTGLEQRPLRFRGSAVRDGRHDFEAGEVPPQHVSLEPWGFNTL